MDFDGDWAVEQSLCHQEEQSHQGEGHNLGVGEIASIRPKRSLPQRQWEEDGREEEYWNVAIVRYREGRQATELP